MLGTTWIPPENMHINNLNKQLFTHTLLRTHQNQHATLKPGSDEVDRNTAWFFLHFLGPLGASVSNHPLEA